jgi:ABC-type lipoprotein release transport system permease subunit
VKNLGQIVGNILLYGLLVYFAVDSLFLDPDPWFAFVVLFVLVVALLITLIPGLHAKGVSPGEYPYED